MFLCKRYHIKAASPSHNTSKNEATPEAFAVLVVPTYPIRPIHIIQQQQQQQQCRHHLHRVLLAGRCYRPPPRGRKQDYS